jgi:glyoxylase-like metal-dependent hydrolase (beta-lactamase superfamily II)
MSQNSSTPKFYTEPLPPRAVPLDVLRGIRRIVANNPGPMTYHGTNTYLIAEQGGFLVVDPGPDDPAHIAAIRAATGDRISRIVLTHTHIDHVAGLPALRGDIPVYAFADLQVPGIKADFALRDGAAVAGWTAIHTPGHANDHLCFQREDGVVISGDHIMGWSTTVVSPPHGDMVAYFASLDRMLEAGGHTYLPGHGPAITSPAEYTGALRAHRVAREAAILAALDEPKTIGAVTATVYAGLAARLLPAAERNVLAHLQKLRAERRAVEADGVWRATR